MKKNKGKQGEIRANRGEEGNGIWDFKKDGWWVGVGMLVL